MQIPYPLQLWLQEKVVPLAVMAILLAVGLLLLQFSAGHRRRARLRERSGHTEDGFVQHLSTIGFDPGISRSTYRFLQEEQNIRYPVLLHDSLDEDLGMNSSDVEESIAALLLANQRTPLAGLRDVPVLTVEDLVRVIQASPRIAQKVA